MLGLDGWEMPDHRSDPNPTLFEGGKMAINFVQFMCRLILVYPAPVAVEEGDGPSLRETSMIAETQGGVAATFGCFSNGSCCVGHGGQGCVDLTCCENVCFANEFCCSIGWTAECASLAKILCGDTCAGSCPGDGACCESHTGGGCDDDLCCDLVCNHTASCCEDGWSETCADFANIICDVCDEPPVCPTEGDCCADHAPGVGCERENCCEIVCQLDSFCCAGEWDICCVRVALNNCPNICECETFGDFDINGAVNLRDIAAFLVCFTGAGSSPVAPGCECADYDADDDADLDDFVPFVALLAR